MTHGPRLAAALVMVVGFFSLACGGSEKPAATLVCTFVMEDTMKAVKLSQYLPARQDVVGALGLRRAEPPALLAGMGLFGAGLLIGAALALLLTPRNGAELRTGLRERIDALRDRVRTARPDGEDRESARA